MACDRQAHGMARRSPHGERGLKFDKETMRLSEYRRSPHGERGLKYHNGGNLTGKGCVALLMESVD